MSDKDLTYLNQILDCIIDIELFVEGYSENLFVTDKKTFNSSIRMFEVMGEATKKISSDLKNKFPEVEWKKMAGLRDVLIHDYEGVDLSAVWQIIQINVPNLKMQIKKIIQNYN
ncbi:MAG: DUF86 domain-containing protein [Bacteroidetes bacterium]|nr:DUF86 domain-containing protein [Bacteroidota bacterium]